MSAGSFETNSLGWQVRQLRRQLNEWFEYQWSQLDIDPPPLPQWSWPEAFGRGLFWLIVVGLALGLSWLLCRQLMRLWRRQHRTGAVLTTAATIPTRSAQHWWHQANTYAQQQQYREACRALYLAALQHLNDRQILPHDRSRTDGEYLQSLEPILQTQPYQLLIRTHERIEFGDISIGLDNYQRCRRAYQEIQKS